MKQSDVNRPKRGRYIYETNAPTITPVHGGGGTSIKYSEITDDSLNQSSHELYQYKTLTMGGGVLEPNKDHLIEGGSQLALGKPYSYKVQNGTRTDGVWGTNGSQLVKTYMYPNSVGSVNSQAAIGTAPNGDSLQIYNGVSWSKGPNEIHRCWMPTITGVFNSALTYSPSYDYDNTNHFDLFNGSVWSSVGTYVEVRGCGTAGRSNALVCAGGINESDAAIKTCITYDGTSILTYGTLPKPICHSGMCGIKNASLIVGGTDGTSCYSNSHCYASTLGAYNAVVWNIHSYCNYSRYEHVAVGNTNNSLIFGGYTGDGTSSGNSMVPISEYYNGNTWSIRGRLIKSRACAGDGSSNSALAVGGDYGFIGGNPPYEQLNTVEQYTEVQVPVYITYSGTTKDNLYRITSDYPLTFSEE